MLISFVKNLLKLLLCPNKFDIFLMKPILWSFCFAIFHSHLSYVCSVWGQSIVSSHKVYFTEKCSTYNLFCKIQWSFNSTWFGIIWKCIFINKCFSCNSHSTCSHLYILATGRHNQQTRFATNYLLILPSCNNS